MKASHIFLRPEITREDAAHIIRWLHDHSVTKYLHENEQTARAIQQALDRCPLPTLTHLFHNSGAMFMECQPGGVPVGFLRLEKHANGTEIVVVIGEKKQWGRGIGTAAVSLALEHAFFTWRTEQMVAHIHPENKRSMRAFRALGFSQTPLSPSCARLTLCMRDYLNGLMEPEQREAAIGE